MRRVRIILKGRVQMVGFRYYAARNAMRLGIKGYVRNLPSGELEVAAEGEDDRMDEFIAAVKKGPSAAEVRDFDEDDNPRFDEEFDDFSIRY